MALTAQSSPPDIILSTPSALGAPARRFPNQLQAAWMRKEPRDSTNHQAANPACEPMVQVKPLHLRHPRGLCEPGKAFSPSDFHEPTWKCTNNITINEKINYVIISRALWQKYNIVLLAKSNPNLLTEHTCSGWVLSYLDRFLFHLVEGQGEHATSTPSLQD